MPGENDDRSLKIVSLSPRRETKTPNPTEETSRSNMKTPREI